MTNNLIIKEDLNKIFNSTLIDWSKFHNKTVLVSGANGFLPAYMVESLLHLNTVHPYCKVKVLALVRNLQKAHTRFKEYKENPFLKFIHQDVTQEIKIEQKIDFIIHAASQASPKYYGVDPVGTLSANVLGTINLTNLAKQHNVEAFLYFSSGEVYGKVDDKYIPIKEDNYGFVDPTNVRSCYAESKRMGENICVSWHHQYNVNTKIVRPFHTYGPKMLLDDGRVYSDFISDVLNERDIVMKSDGKATRAFCYLSDATIAFFLVLLQGEVGQAYNVGNPAQEYSILSLAKTLAGLYPEKKIGVIEVKENNNNEYLKSPVQRNSPDISKLQQLGWHPEVDIKNGFRRTIESYIS